MTQDPAAFLRSMIGEWAGGQEQAASGGLRSIVDQGLTAANIPTRNDLDAVNARLDALEQRLAQLELRLRDTPDGKKKKKKPK